MQQTPGAGSGSGAGSGQGTGFMGNSAIPPYLKATAAAVLALTYLACLSDAIYQTIFHPTAALPTDVTFVLGTGMGIALQIIGAHTGASLSNESPHPGMVAAPALPSMQLPVDNTPTPVPAPAPAAVSAPSAPVTTPPPASGS